MVVHALVVFEERLVSGIDIDVTMVKRVIDFMQNFADKCHHAKEESILFPAMEQKGVPKIGCPLGGLRAEHVKGRALVQQLEETLHEYEKQQSHAARKMIVVFSEIRKLYPNHIWKEDEMVFPMAQRLFQKEELDSLKRDFDQAEKEFGHRHDEHVMFSKEMNELHRINHK
jgi:hemerythrin-like domain-containing protein